MTDSQNQNPVEGLEAAFTPPQQIADDEVLGPLYLEIVSRLRTESLGIPMHTAQELLLERIATKYVLIKLRESTGWVGVRSESEANQEWRELLKEWNRVLAQGHEQLREAVLRSVEKITVDAVALVKDHEDRQALRRHFKEQFAALGY